MSTSAPHMGSDRNLDHLFPVFRARVDKLISNMKAAGFTPKVVEGLRSTAYQQWLYAQGRTRPGKKVTDDDGVHNISKHQHGMAVDLVDDTGGKINWNNIKFYAQLSKEAKALGLEWGGWWKTLVDKPHVQWPAADHKTYLAADKWVRENKFN